MRTRPKTTFAAALLATVATVGITAASGAAGPTGTYPNVDMTGKITTSSGNGRFDPFVGRFRLKRSKIQIDAIDEDRRLLVRMTMKLRDGVRNTDRQTIKVDSGSISFKDLDTGAPAVWGGRFNKATYKVRAKSNGRWELKSKKKLKIQGLVGDAEYGGGLVKSTKIKATR